MSTFDPNRYGPVFAELLATDRNRPLGGGKPDSVVPSQLRGLDASAAFDQQPIADRQMASACLAGVWLLYDRLDESHRLSQDISTTSGSFWHGIMHRREGDFSNAKYWFRNVGHHEIYAPLAEAADNLATQHGAEDVLPAGGWDAMAFVDACQDAARGSGQHEAFCRAVQQVEWELLFDHCYRHAVR